jgi:predicted dithiol-disulfide oxidoreductase (DUF899 family)
MSAMGNTSPTKHKVVSQKEWLAARRALLAKEKELTRQRDRLSEERRALPWVKIEKDYVFVYGPEWEEGCPSCSFWADNFNGAIVHLKARDVTMIAVSRAPYPALKGFQKRMGWSFKWVSSLGSDFNYDFQASFTPEQLKGGKVFYNFEKQEFPSDEAPGVSVFFKDEAGTIFHTYSAYSRGIDAMNGAYQLLDLAPKGRDEQNLPWTMAWVRHHDKYGT